MLRKKIISLGLSAATAGTLAFTVAAPAASANHTVQHTVCLALPAALVSQNGVVATANLTRTQAGTALGNAQTALDQATAQYLSAIQALINAVDGGGDDDLAGANLNVATENIGAKFSNWTNTYAADFAAQYALDVAEWQLGIINGLNVPCVPAS